MKLSDYIEKLRQAGKLDEYADACGVTSSYMDRVLKKPYYYPKQRALKALYRESKRNVTKTEVEEHFAQIKKELGK